MCGICGVAFTDPHRSPDTRQLHDMTSVLVHRGPDSAGVHVAPGVGLGVRRLAIIDVKHGDQPIANEAGTVTVVCNGEIYNHVELRQRLAAEGCRFRTASDVEVIVHLYERHGPDFVHHLRGMFAIALWDAPRRQLLLVRDRLGIKPLHYAVLADRLVFASEQKALLHAGLMAAEADLHAIAELFSYGRIRCPRTIVKNVRRLPAGHMLTFAAGTLTLRQYWDVRFPARDGYDTRVPAAEWARRLRAKLDESVQLHLRSDVPVGAWLSGGIDSSAVTALMARNVERAVPTFTLRFEDARFDELASGKALDDFAEYRLEGHRVFCSPKDLERLPRAILHGEDTLMAGIIVGQLLVAEASAAHVKVVLTGEGADEVLGGYSWYPTLRLMQPLMALPRAVRRALAAFGPVRRRWPGAASVLEGGRAIDLERYSRSITHLRGAAWAERLLAPHVRERIAGEPETVVHAGVPDEIREWHPFAQLQYFDMKERLAIVEQGLDRASMAHSVEARVPFLDHELVELCARIPPGVKMRGLREKHVLREAMHGIVPAEIRERRKSPMRLPTDHWMRGPLPGFAEELLAPRALSEAGYFDARAVAHARRRHAAGESLGQVLMAVLGVQLWDDIFRRGGRVSDMRA